MRAIDQILTQMSSKKTFVCCGLDPDLSKLPFEIQIQKISDEEKVLNFLKVVVDVTASHVCVYKAQKAFFDTLYGGHEVLRELISYVHKVYPGLMIIIDCKIGDIDNTMSAYIKTIFDKLNADGIVANPYMGNDTIIPLADLREKAIVVLAKTSNVSGDVVQDVILQNGLPLWKYILNLIVNNWNYNSNMIPVVSSTAMMNMLDVRSIIPDSMPILFAGVGAQGGNYSDFGKLLNSSGTGVFVNSSRGILYPTSQNIWAVGVEEAVIELKDSLNKEGRRK
jgi:orotidine-5'-phosphate decarboxylase